MNITVHRPNQIGGCITEIESNLGSRIIIDVGSNLPGTVSEEVYVKELTKCCAGVFVTHYHGDHVGEFGKVDEHVPIYMGEIGHKVFLNLRETLWDEHIEVARSFETFSAKDRIPVGDMFVTPYRVDHSAYDSYMFLIECDGKKILHTGDFRTHGLTGKGVNALLKHYVKKVDFLICEGTMLSSERESEKMYTEHDLYKDAKGLMLNNKNVFVLCSSTNIDSIASFYKAAIETEKIIVADKYQCSNLDIVTEDAKSDPKVSGIYNFNRKNIYTYSSGNTKLHNYMRGKGFCMFIRAKPFFEDALRRFPDNLLIYSMWEGYLEVGKSYTNPDLIGFLDRARENGSSVKPLHTSGHAYEEAIIELCGIIQPDVIFPIHSPNPGRFEELAKEKKIGGIVKRLDSKKGVDPMKILSCVKEKTSMPTYKIYKGIPYSSHVDINSFDNNDVSIYIKFPYKNMQTDDACFEALALMSKVKGCGNVEIGFNTEYVKSASIKPAHKNAYHRFLYRLDMFQRAFSTWASLTKEAADERDAFVSRMNEQSPSNNIPDKKAEFNENKGEEHVIENKLARTNDGRKYLSEIYQRETGSSLRIDSIHNQLPCGLFDCGVTGKPKEENRILARGFFDIWGFDENDNFCVFELKKDKGNTHLGVISELFFYAVYSHDILLNLDRLHQKRSKVNHRGYDTLYDAVNSKAAKSVGAYFLLGQGAHSLIKDNMNALIELMNSNMFAIKFGTVQYDVNIVNGFGKPDLD